MCCFKPIEKKMLCCAIFTHTRLRLTGLPARAGSALVLALLAPSFVSLVDDVVFGDSVLGLLGLVGSESLAAGLGLAASRFGVGFATFAGVDVELASSSGVAGSSMYRK